MSTRSKTRAAAASSKTESPLVSNPKLVKQASAKAKAGRATIDKRNGTKGGDLVGKENLKAKSEKKPQTRGKGKAVAPSKDVYCTCSQGDNGSPMVRCAECKIWYHFTCVDLSEPDAEDICLYICPSCSKATGRRTAMTWEGPDALEELQHVAPVVAERCASVPPKAVVKEKKPILYNTEEGMEEDDDDESSQDEYTGEDDLSKARQVSAGLSTKKRRNQSSGSDSEPSISVRHKQRRRISKVSASPTPTRQLHPKRKASAPFGLPPPNKRKKSDEITVTDDPVRKYCLGKLEELFLDIFSRYPYVRVEAGAESGESKAKTVSKPLDEMADAEKEKLAEESKQFALGLEQCIFEIYSEPDRHGNPHAGGNYKDRFRMLQFNLSKPDRVVIHQRITSASISPKEISLMSSTDLADEETKQSIIIAEKEALEHSILQKSTAPRSKITHKGLQDIEDVNGGSTSTAPDLDVQHDRDLEGEERRERERMARLRAVQRQRTTSISVPPDSPTVSQTPTSEVWGAPPPVPPHALSAPVDEPESLLLRQPPIPLFIRPGSDVARYTPEPELNLADLINIDEDPSDAPPDGFSVTPSLEKPTTNIDATYPPHQPDFSSSSILPSSPTGISPFAARPERTRAPSFDLNSLWSGSMNNDEGPYGSGMPLSSSPPTEQSPPAVTKPAAALEQQTAPSDAPAVEDMNDQDFDMFLEDQDQEDTTDTTADATAVIPQFSVDSLPQVWKGKISMPLDSTIPQETSMTARQIAGPTLEPESALWQTLFPSDHLRIDGRVPVDGSAKYLLQMRMNPSKELYGAVLTPVSDDDESGFTALCDFLTAKSRHGLVFPWGSRPKDHHPGREFYIIPLLANDPLPEYMELLDNLKLPKDRQRNYLIGIWILNKGKLAPPTTPPLPPPIVAAPPAPVLTNHPSIVTPVSNIPSFTPPLHIPTTISPINTQPIVTTPAPPPTIPTMPNINNLPIEPAALAAEVASLTPEQIQNVIRTLQMAGASFPIPNIPQPPVPQPPMSQPFVPPMPTLPHQQAWHSPIPAPPYTAAYPPVPPSHRSPSNEPHRPAYDQYDRNQDRGYQGDRSDRGNRGWRGRGRGRGTTGRDRDQRDTPHRPVDSGWPRRQRNDSTGGESHDTSRRW